MGRKWAYSKLVFRTAAEESRGELHPHIKMAVISALATVLVFGTIGAVTGKSVAAGLLGAASGLALALLAGLLLYLWNLGGTPAKLWASSQETIERVKTEAATAATTAAAEHARVIGERDATHARLVAEKDAAHARLVAEKDSVHTHAIAEQDRVIASLQAELEEERRPAEQLHAELTADAFPGGAAVRVTNRSTRAAFSATCRVVTIKESVTNPQWSQTYALRWRSSGQPTLTLASGASDSLLVATILPDIAGHQGAIHEAALEGWVGGEPENVDQRRWHDGAPEGVLTFYVEVTLSSDGAVGTVSKIFEVYSKQWGGVGITEQTGATIDSVDVPRRVQRALRNLFDAYRELELVRNRTNEDCWNAFSERLQEYKVAYELLPPVARRFHERDLPALTHLVRKRKFDRLMACMNDASDIMLNGECELDLTVSRPTPIIVKSHSSDRRDRFVILNMVIGNREDQTVSLYPTWDLFLDPGRVHAIYQADAEPLQDWEEIRRNVPRPATPPLDMPLTLQPHSAATGYWCFFVGSDLEGNRRLMDGRRFLDSVLEIRDLLSGRRTKSERFHLEVERMQLLLETTVSDSTSTPADRADTDDQRIEED